MKSIITLLFVVDLTLGAQTSVFGLGNDLKVSAVLKSLLIVSGYLLLFTRRGRPCLASSDISRLDAIVYFWAAISTIAVLIGLMQPTIALGYLVGDYYKFLSLSALLPLFYLGIHTRSDLNELIDRVVVLFSLSAFIFLGLFGLGVVRIYTITPPGIYVSLITPVLLSNVAKRNHSWVRGFAILGLAEAVALLYCSQSLNLVLTSIFAGIAYLMFSKRLPLRSLIAGTAVGVVFGLFLYTYSQTTLDVADRVKDSILNTSSGEMHIIQKFRLLLLKTDMTPGMIVDSLGGGRTGELLGLIEYLKENPQNLLVGAGMGSLPNRVGTELNPDPLRAHSSESTYGETLYRTGVVGLCVLLWLQVRFVKGALRLAKTPQTLELAAAALAFGCALTVGYFMGLWIAQPFLLWFLLLVAVFARKRRPMYYRVPKSTRVRIGAPLLVPLRVQRRTL